MIPVHVTPVCRRCGSAMSQYYDGGTCTSTTFSCSCTAARVNVHVPEDRPNNRHERRRAAALATRRSA